MISPYIEQFFALIQATFWGMQYGM